MQEGYPTLTTSIGVLKTLFSVQCSAVHAHVHVLMTVMCVAMPAEPLCLQMFWEVVMPKGNGILGLLHSSWTKFQLQHAKADTVQRMLSQKVRCFSPSPANHRLRLWRDSSHSAAAVRFAGYQSGIMLSGCIKRVRAVQVLAAVLRCVCCSTGRAVGIFSSCCVASSNIHDNSACKMLLALCCFLCCTLCCPALQLEAGMPKQMASAYHEISLDKATFKLTDFGRAVPFKGLLPGLPEGAAEAAGKEARDLLQQAPQRYNRDGVVVFSDPTYRPPEVSADGK